MSTIITAPDRIPIEQHPAVFLAGGIQGCDDWQKRACEKLEFDAGAVYNPRRGDFGELTDAKVREQITWEYHAINFSDIFSIWFCASDSVQPICLYELGRVIGMQHKEIIVGVETGYLRTKDVVIQCGLAGVPILSTRLDGHILNIRDALLRRTRW